MKKGAFILIPIAIKYLVIFILFVAAMIFFFSCTDNHTTTSNVAVTNYTTTINGFNMQTYVIDSCEYIGHVEQWTSNANVLTHKGNCRFCKARQEKMMLTHKATIKIW